jgi:DNA-binding LacI/PurR family transcriptional regulator
LDKAITAQDVADLAGVSRTTVSFVLNEEKRESISEDTRQKVFDAIDQLGYVPNITAQALASRSAKAIGLVMTRSPRYIASDTFLPQIIGGLLDVVKETNLSLLVEWVESGEQITVYRKLIQAKHIDGMILLTPRQDDQGLKELESLEVPAVLMGTLTETKLSSVDLDNRAAAKMAVSHLIERNHRRIACITNAGISFSSAQERLLGYRDALEEAGIAFDQELVRYADFDPQSGSSCMHDLLDQDLGFTAVFVASDNVAMGALSAIRAHGLQVPEDLSVVGFDDITWAKFASPPLTTVHLPAQKLAKSACLLLLELIKNETAQVQRQEIETELIIRDSTAYLS